MRRYILYALITIILAIFWVGLEWILDGQIISQHSDTVICLVLGWFIMDWVDYYIFEK
ncbi:hypothetical protein [Clostridium sp.]|uniref:hypothetical protein n=1 Tax=Clostridium sp. TaxID=1506 RepID=UPI001D3B41FE|nr:hypothetical protein [Clostridium sp.]MBS5307683.1 hypothetical protein [Clostridium sp.]MDU3409993.1 hypothetical protein [Clostridium sp.]